MSNEFRHSSDDLDRVRMQANKIFGTITDYTAGVEPSLLFQCIWFTEFERVCVLSGEHQALLAQMREEIASACGINHSP